MMSKASSLKLIILTPIFLLLSHNLAFFLHEYAHSFMAWFLGYKMHPLDLYYGGNSLANLLLLIDVNENINYSSLFHTAPGFKITLIAFAGPGIANGLLYLLSYYYLKSPKPKSHPYLFYFIFCFNLMNLGNLYDYVPLRTFSGSGDVEHFVQGLGISPWIIFVVFGYIVALAIYYFFKKTLQSAYLNLQLGNAGKASLMILSVLFIFGYFAVPGIIDTATISHFLGLASVIAIPGIILVLWPNRTMGAR